MSNFLNIKCIILFFCIFPIAVISYSQKYNDIISQFKTDIFTLASDSMQGRRAGSLYEKKTYMYLKNELHKKGLKTSGKNWVHPFTFKDEDSTVKTAYNVITQIDNKSKKTIVFGAHYDHLGMGGVKSRSIGKKAIHNGADDNASGVSIILQIARYLKESRLKKYNYLFVFFSAHEEGLFGSEEFVKNSNLNKIKLMINFDMVGRLDTSTRTLKIFAGTDNFISDSLLNSLNQFNFNLKINRDPMKKESDAYPFYIKHIPVLFISTGIHDDYHKVSDDAEKINYNGMVDIYNYIKSIIIKLN